MKQNGNASLKQFFIQKERTVQVFEHIKKPSSGYVFGAVESRVVSADERVYKEDIHGFKFMVSLNG